MYSPHPLPGTVSGLPAHDLYQAKTTFSELTRVELVWVTMWLFTMNVSLCECVSVCIGYLKGKMSEENQNNQVQICRSEFFSVNRSLGCRVLRIRGGLEQAPWNSGMTQSSARVELCSRSGCPKGQVLGSLYNSYCHSEDAP